MSNDRLSKVNTSGPRLIIIADDLTGAADSAARARRIGLSAEVLLEFTNGKTMQLPTALTAATSINVLAINTDSRHLDASKAAARVTAAVESASRHANGAVWYKKLDSTLRGHLGAEVAAMLAALSHLPAALVCPAFPAQGRGLENGYLVHKTIPPRTLHLPSLLMAQTDLPVLTLDLATVRGDDFAQALAQAQAAGARLIVADALTEADLAVLVAAGRKAGLLLCGSAGMVAPLAAHLQPTTATDAATDAATATIPAAPRDIAAVADGPVLIVVGSGSATAHRQVATLVEMGMVRVRTLEHSWHTLDLVGAEGHPQGDWLINLAPPLPDAVLDGPAARVRAMQLADLAHIVVDRLQPTALILVGGDTAYYILRTLGIGKLTVVDEVLPGVPLTTGVDGEGVTRTVVLKAGSFGDADTLGTIHQALRRDQPVLVAH